MVTITSIKKFPDNTFGIKLSNNAVHVGSRAYLSKLLKNRYGISF